MSAKLKVSLYIGASQERFDDGDIIKLKLKTGQVLKGTLHIGCTTDCFILETENGDTYSICPDDIKYHIAE